MRRLIPAFAALLLLGFGLGGSGLLRAPATPELTIACADAPGAAALLERPKGDLIVIDGTTVSARAAAAIGCLAAARGEMVVFAAEASPALEALAANLAAAGARSAAEELTEGGDDEAARAAALAAAVGAARTEHSADRVIVLVSPPDGARAPVGLSGHTWRPMGALLPVAETIALRAEESARPGVRIKLTPFSDVPERGAAMRYDGLIEVGPEPASTAHSALR